MTTQQLTNGLLSVIIGVLLRIAFNISQILEAVR